MKIGLQIWGSEGDLRPFLALGAGLAEAGHQVRLVYTGYAGAEQLEWAREHGVRLTVQPVPGVETPAAFDVLAERLVNTGTAFRQAEMILDQAFDPALEGMAQAATALCQESDLVVGHFFVHPLQAAAELSGVPWVSVHLAHSGVVSRHITPPSFPRLGEACNHLFWRLARAGANRIFLPRINAYRQGLRLPLLRDTLLEAWTSKLLTVVAVDEAFATRRADWPAGVQLTGPLDVALAGSGVVCPAELERFLQSGAPPVYFSFGSMLPASRDAVAPLARVWAEAAALAPCRAILQLPGGGAAWPEFTGNLFVVERAPHETVFPRCAAVVHHAGAGTSHTALRAGVPSVPVPHMADQFFWSAELRRLGLASGPVRRRGLAPSPLAAAIREVLGKTLYRERARHLAARARASNGLPRAVELISKAGAQLCLN